MDLIWSEGFKRSFKKLTKKNHQLKPKIFDVLSQLAKDPFTPSLKSHKLSGNLGDLWSCSVTYDCRIIFSLSEDGEDLAIVILLVDIGSHDQVYRNY
ncbi:MAG: type II toxin-antitoxin system YafQ family toxin [Microcystaceae cyanobacterium]